MTILLADVVRDVAMLLADVARAVVGALPGQGGRGNGERCGSGEREQGLRVTRMHGASSFPGQWLPHHVRVSGVGVTIGPWSADLRPVSERPPRNRKDSCCDWRC